MQEDAGAYGAIEDAALAVKDGRIAYLGPMSKLPDFPLKLADSVKLGSGAWITPGLIDCHTHLIFAGNRADEFEMRLEGASYEEIAKAGGGILSTVAATRAASAQDLVEAAAGRLQSLMRDGVTTVEVKSGYGLETETELKMLRAAGALSRQLPLRIEPTFLGAHALPPEWDGDADGYIDLVSEEMLPQIKNEGLATAVDAFLETIAFNNNQIERLFKAAKRLDFRLKLHADQLSNSRGAALAASYGALSADHLEHTSASGIAAMAEAGTVAVLLPGAYYTLRETKSPPIAGFRKAGVPMAIASDANPGSSPSLSLRLMMNMAATLFGLSPEEALAGVTRNAARALGLGAEIGTLEVGKRADLAIWNITRPAELTYWLGGDICAARVFGGEIYDIAH
ncbi:MAG: imidazolonepropionase [Sphingomonadales bacterium]